MIFDDFSLILVWPGRGELSPVDFCRTQLENYREWLWMNVQIRCWWMLCNFERIYEILLKILLVVFELSPREVDFATGLSSKTTARVIG